MKLTSTVGKGTGVHIEINKLKKKKVLHFLLWYFQAVVLLGRCPAGRNTQDQHSADIRYLLWRKHSNRPNTWPGLRGRDWLILWEWPNHKWRYGWWRIYRMAFRISFRHNSLVHFCLIDLHLTMVFVAVIVVLDGFVCSCWLLFWKKKISKLTHLSLTREGMED